MYIYIYEIMQDLFPTPPPRTHYVFMLDFQCHAFIQAIKTHASGAGGTGTGAGPKKGAMSGPC